MGRRQQRKRELKRAKRDQSRKDWRKAQNKLKLGTKRMKGAPHGGRSKRSARRAHVDAASGFNV